MRQAFARFEVNQSGLGSTNGPLDAEGTRLALGFDVARSKYATLYPLAPEPPGDLREGFRARTACSSMGR